MGFYCGLTVLFDAQKRERDTKNPPAIGSVGNKTIKIAGSLLLPSALLMAIGLQTLAALVFVHLETAFFLEVAHC